MNLLPLAEPHPDIDQALAVVEAFDTVLVGGLLRPHPAQAAALEDLADAFAGSPLAALVAEAAGKAAAGSASEDHLTVLAAARTALLGSVHDALLQRADEAAGRTRAVCVTEPVAAPPRQDNVLAAARAWLCDVARTGWQGMDHDLAAAAAPVVAALLPEPSLRRLAVLLDGFAGELAATCPGATAERYPVRRWADLWARAVMLCHPAYPAHQFTQSVSGRLLPLGVDLHEHPGAAQAQVYAVLEPADGSGARLVRASVSVTKPATVVGAGVWQLLREHCSLLAAAATGRTVDVDEMPATEAGDLDWSEDRARQGGPAEVFATARVALTAAAGGAVAPLERHPAALAVPVFLEGYQVAEDDGVLTVSMGGHSLPVDASRAPAASPLDARAIKASRACVGLLRWDDGRFLLQALAVTDARGTAVHAAGSWAAGTDDKNGAKAEKAATAATQALRERAGKLLRR